MKSYFILDASFIAVINYVLYLDFIDIVVVDYKTVLAYKEAFMEYKEACCWLVPLFAPLCATFLRPVHLSCGCCHFFPLPPRRQLPADGWT